MDEVHRFNKAQQDALLPWVENGTVILIGATTENPYFEVNKALVSRSRIFQLKSLGDQDLERVITQALQDGDRGYGTLPVQLDPAARSHLVNVCNGDARALLNALELAVETTPPQADGMIHISLDVAEESIQRRAVLYDKEGDAHFDTISAFIKSLRGSDPDAAMYWLARMVYAGEDPRFIFRRMLILAGEDVGMADPQAIAVVHACAQTFDRVGMPEGRYPLAQAALYLATCPKSNSVMGFFDALAAVEQEREDDVPLHLRDPSRDKHSFGHGAGYLYPHAYRDHWVEQQYLPHSLQGQVFYQPSGQGYEGGIQQDVARKREAQLAALVEGIGSALPEVLTFSPPNAGMDRWLQRTLSQTGERLGAVRDRLFTLAPPQRHHIVLDLNASSGLLTWEAVRRVPEGAVYACVDTAQAAIALQEQAAALPELNRPLIVQTSLLDLPQRLQSDEASLRFDRILGRNIFGQGLRELPDQIQSGLRALVELLQPDGVMVLAEAIPKYTQRLYQLIEPERLGVKLHRKLAKAEESIYTHADQPILTWDIEDLKAQFKDVGTNLDLQLEHTQTDLRITPALLDRWFSPGGDTRSAQANQRPSYLDHLQNSLTAPEIGKVREVVFTVLQHQTVPWQGAIAFIRIQPSN